MGVFMSNVKRKISSDNEHILERAANSKFMLTEMLTGKSLDGVAVRITPLEAIFLSASVSGGDRNKVWQAMGESGGANLGIRGGGSITMLDKAKKSNDGADEYVSCSLISNIYLNLGLSYDTDVIMVDDNGSEKKLDPKGVFLSNLEQISPRTNEAQMKDDYIVDLDTIEIISKEDFNEGYCRVGRKSMDLCEHIEECKRVKKQRGMSEEYSGLAGLYGDDVDLVAGIILSSKDEVGVDKGTAILCPSRELSLDDSVATLLKVEEGSCVEPRRKAPSLGEIAGGLKGALDRAKDKGIGAD